MVTWQDGHPFARYWQRSWADEVWMQGKHQKWQKKKFIVVPEDLADLVRVYVVLIDLSV